MTAFEPINLGDRVKDPVTGYAGIVICITTWLQGCIRVGVQPEKLDKDGKQKEPVHFDQSQLVMVKKRVHEPMTLTVVEAPKVERRSNGGPARENASFRRF